ncbi:hypothetical protein DENSPDRAFT_885450 [Dentipellis sp. KUC8613]|nr:hypothetical protein DENSPDRAFT_885450 [Dentipellis sp. KUC8613]
MDPLAHKTPAHRLARLPNHTTQHLMDKSGGLEGNSHRPCRRSSRSPPGAPVTFSRIPAALTPPHIAHRAPMRPLPHTTRPLTAVASPLAPAVRCRATVMRPHIAVTYAHAAFTRPSGVASLLQRHRLAPPPPSPISAALACLHPAALLPCHARACPQLPLSRPRRPLSCLRHPLSYAHRPLSCPCCPREPPPPSYICMPSIRSYTTPPAVVWCALVCPPLPLSCPDSLPPHTAICMPSRHLRAALCHLHALSHRLHAIGAALHAIPLSACPAAPLNALFAHRGPSRAPPCRLCAPLPSARTPRALNTPLRALLGPWGFLTCCCPVFAPHLAIYAPLRRLRDALRALNTSPRPLCAPWGHDTPCGAVCESHRALFVRCRAISCPSPPSVRPAPPSRT